MVQIWGQGLTYRAEFVARKGPPLYETRIVAPSHVLGGPRVIFFLFLGCNDRAITKKNAGIVYRAIQWDLFRHIKFGR